MIVVVCDCVGFCFSVNFCTAPPHVVGGVHQEIVEHTEQPTTGIHVHVHVVIVVVVVVIVIIVVLGVDHVDDQGGGEDGKAHEVEHIELVA